MLKDYLKNHTIILASGSPRRQQFFKDLDIDFTVEVKPVEEIYPNHLKREEITNYLAKLKANAFNSLKQNDILITSDTIVWFNNEAIEKPKNLIDAKNMLTKLSGNIHEVITSVCFKTINKIYVTHNTTKVYFKNITNIEIEYYVNKYKPLDKAGAYGIQEWIGHIAVTKIEGSYNNVIGFPTHLVHEELLKFTKL